MSIKFTEGDHIEVTPKYGFDFDFGYIRGTALSTINSDSGQNTFFMEIGVSPNHKIALPPFDLNYVDVEVLFRADHARRTGRHSTEA